MNHGRAQRYKDGFHVDAEVTVLLKGRQEDRGLQYNLGKRLKGQLTDRPEPPKAFDVHFGHAE